MKKISKILTIAACSALFFACTKTETPDPNNNTNTNTTKTKKDYLMEGKWQLTLAVTKTSISGFPARTDTISMPCTTDGFIVFLANGKGLADAGTLKCSNEPQVDSSGTWSMSDDFSKITFSGNAWGAGMEGSEMTIVTTVQDITASEMKLNYTYDTTMSGFTMNLNTNYVYKNIK